MKKIDRIATVLLLIAAINWSIIGIFNFNLISELFESPILERIAYVVFGLSAIYTVVDFRGMKARWMK